MICYRCGAEVGTKENCPSCGTDLGIFLRIKRISNAYYNLGLEQAKVRNLSGAIESLRRALKFNRNNIDARNLLGLVYCEMGETVDALSEWVISRSYMPEGNIASRYLDTIQQNQGRLDSVNQTIKKYNQALQYCRQDSRDLAIIQLKKVLSLNPKLVRGHQLLALLYMQENKLEQAKKSLRSAVRIDADNTVTLRYLKEVNELAKDSGSSKKSKDDDLISYQSGNETIIMPKRFKESSIGSTLLSIVIGFLIGGAATACLVVPGVRNEVNEQAQQKLLEASETVAAGAQTIRELEEQVAELQGQLEEVAAASAQTEDEVKSYENLLRAYVAYAEGDMVKAGDVIEKVDTSYLSKSAKKIYEGLNEQVQAKYLETLYNDGYSNYSRGRYEDAVDCLQKVVDEKEDYADGNAAYYLAQAYRRGGDLESAKPYYQYILENYPNTERARTARNYADAQQ